jgi:hypothetical protein
MYKNLFFKKLPVALLLLAGRFVGLFNKKSLFVSFFITAQNKELNHICQIYVVCPSMIDGK